MSQWTQRLFELSPYSTALDRDRARILYGVTYLLAAVYAAYMLLPFISPTGQPLLTVVLSDTSNPLFFTFVVFTGTTAGSLLLLRTGHLFGAGWMVSGMLYSGVVAAGLFGMDNLEIHAMVLLIFVLMTAITNQQQGLIVGLAVAVATIIWDYHAGFFAPYPDATLFNLITLIFLLLMSGGFMGIFLRYARLIRIEGGAEATRERLKLASLTQQVTRRAARRPSLNELMEDVLSLILENYPDIYHAQIFLVDESGMQARLAASTGEIGQKLIARQHSLEVGSVSVIGQVTLRGEPVIAVSGATAGVHRRNEFLPDTTLEAAFSLQIEGRIIGALDLQSKTLSALEESDIATFRALANSIALAIDNLRLAERTEERLRDNERLVEQLRGALGQVERLNQRLIGRAWSDYLQTRTQHSSLDIDISAGSPATAGEDWTPALSEAVQQGEIVQDLRDGRRVVAVPLTVRGQVIGAMEFELEVEHELAEEELALIREVSERFGMTAESARLLEESQRIAQRESLVNEISSRLQSTNNVETTLAEAARSLSEALKASKVMIRLEPLQSTTTQNGGGREDRSDG